MHTRTGLRTLGWRATAAVVACVAALAVAGEAPAGAIKACSSSKCPLARDDNYVVTVGQPLQVGAPGLLANDEGTGTTSVDVGNSDTTSWLEATVFVHSDGSFNYIPDPKSPATGDDSFDYYLQDGHGNWDFATANIEVRAIVRDDAYTTTAGKALDVKAPGVLKNDVGVDPTSLDADLTSAHGGDVTMNDDGSFSYTPPANFKGADTFTYTVSDTNGDNTYTSTVHIGVDAPATAGTTPAPPNTKPVDAGATSTTRPGPSRGPGASTGGTVKGSGSTTPGASTAKGSATSTTARGATAGSADGGGAGSNAAGARLANPAHHSGSSVPAWPFVVGVLVVAAGAAAFVVRRRVAGRAAGSPPAAP